MSGAAAAALVVTALAITVVTGDALVQANPTSPSAPQPSTTAPPGGPPDGSPEDGAWTTTVKPNATVVPGKMRSDREAVPGGFSKEDADLAETMEAAASGDGSDSTASATPGCQVYWPAPYEVCGAIKDKYNELGGPNSFLLWPTSNEIRNPDGVGAHSTFQNGPIYWSPWGGAHPVVNHFFAAWQRNGWEAGVLGYPTSDELVNPDGVGRRQYFDGGTIYWKLNDAYFVGGAIRDKWGETGWETGFLGYPTSDETATPDGIGRFNSFEHGSIYWTAETGAHPVSGGIQVKWGMTNFEAGPYGYPISDQRQRGQAFDQDFQFGTIGWPTSAVVDDDIDWQEDYIDDANCPGCGDDDRVSVTGPGWTPDPQPEFAPTSEPVNGELFDELPLCSDLESAGDNGPEYRWCRPEPGQELTPQAAWTSELDKGYCKDLPRRQWAGDRKYQCMWRDGVIGIADKDEPEVILGTISVVQENQLDTAWNSTTWNARTVLHVTGTTGIGNEAMFAMSVYCSSDVTCSHNFNNSEPPRPVTETLYKRDYTLSAPVGVGAISRTTGFAEFTFTHPIATPVTTKAAASPTIRCDQLAGFRNSAGCIVRAAEPILDMSARNVPALSTHIGYAQASGLPGAPNGTPLTRTNKDEVIQGNRNITCNRVPGPRPAGRQCDEYPFASTYEGGGASGPSRTYQGNPCEQSMPTWVNRLSVPVGFYNAQGVSMCMMPGRDNMRGGGITTWFYVKNRVHDGDTFYVKGA
ncbi:NucA/NucB deoxyribonuclease domain-containing protein [Nocardia cyriacigeorgica]|uniref:NucA/NucB deoxyribonuclease domain-containing protein n=1 Tax=Nocardia cyriacigeorgica TaxID=135487 RepID=UPI001E40F837|nr:hypothetical protein [Nocardia cyriacigeorgica]